MVSVVACLRTPKTKRELREAFFLRKIYPKIARNPYEHYTKHDFSAKRLENIEGHCVHGQFKPTFTARCESRLVFQ